MRILIAGAGLAGCSLAHHLRKRNVQVTLLHNGTNASSMIAAGIINPIVFRRTTLSWRITELLPVAHAFYRELEELFGESFFHEVPIRRLFAHEQERVLWEEKQTKPEFQPYLKPLSKEDLNFDSDSNTFGTGVVLNSSVVQTRLFMESNWRFFAEQGILKEEQFDYEKLDPKTATYNDETFDFIVFAEGKDGKYNPWFSYLPLSQTKGEVLTLRFDKLSTAESLNRKCFLMPFPDGTFKAGSTYVWETDNTIPTEEGKAQILHNLLSVTNEIPEVVEHEAGVRPTVTDRRPLIGKHPTFQKLVIANGLGTKGFMIAPLAMQELAEHLLDGKELHQESNITRFQSAKVDE